MSHIDVFLTRNIEIGALRIDPQDNLEVIPMDNGRTVRNSRVTVEPVRWEIAFPTVDAEGNNTSDYESVRQMWTDTERGLHTFNFTCPMDETVHKVRFASAMQVAGPAGHLRKIETLTLVEDE